MKVLVHMCCGPCSIAPVQYLRKHGVDFVGYFYNPNIHPYREFKQRMETMKAYAVQEQLPLIVDDDYPLGDFLSQVMKAGSERCRECYVIRLREVARKAKEIGCEAFTTTLLVSPYQNHELIKTVGEQIAREEEIPFYYADYRPGWHEAVQQSRDLAMYRQPYCGCIFSEKERYYKA